MDNDSAFVSLNGLILRKSEASISPAVSGVYYGAGCFETMRAESTLILKFNGHMARLNRGLSYLGVPASKLEDPSAVYADILALLKKNRLETSDARVRVQISLEEQHGYRSGKNTSFFRLITTDRLPARPSTKAVSLADVGIRVVPDVCRPTSLKLSNMLHYRQAFRMAEQSGADDALLLTVNGAVAETAIANIFWKKGKDVFTPSAACDILPGLMRETLLEILREDPSIAVTEGKFSPGHLLDADTAWITNSGVEILPVECINGHALSCDQTFFAGLRSSLKKYKEKEAGSGI